MDEVCKSLAQFPHNMSYPLTQHNFRELMVFMCCCFLLKNLTLPLDMHHYKWKEIIHFTCKQLMEIQLWTKGFIKWEHNSILENQFPRMKVLECMHVWMPTTILNWQALISQHLFMSLLPLFVGYRTFSHLPKFLQLNRYSPTWNRSKAIRIT